MQLVQYIFLRKNASDKFALYLRKIPRISQLNFLNSKEKTIITSPNSYNEIYEKNLEFIRFDGFLMR